MSNYPPPPPPPPQYADIAHFPEEPRRPLPPPPLPPRRPISDFYGTPEQSIYAQAHGEFGPPSAPVSPSLPQQQQYGGYGGPISGGGYPPPQQHANIYGRTSNPLYNQPPPVRKSSIPYGQSSAYSTTSPYGKTTSSQQSPYGQSGPYGQQQYENTSSQAPSPYGKTASPNLIQEPYSQNIPHASYQSSPPASQTGFPGQPQYGQHESSYAQQTRPQSPHFGKTQSPPPMQSPPLRPPSQTATFNPQNDMGRQSVHGFNEGYKNQDPESFANQSQYAYQDRPASSGFDSVGYNTMDQQQRPSITSPYGSQSYGSQGYSNVPSQQYPGSSQHGYPSQGYPSLPPSQLAPSQTNDPQRISSPPLSQASPIAPPKSPPFLSPSQYDQHATIASARVDEHPQGHQQQPTTNPAQPHYELPQTTPQIPEQISLPQITSPPPEPTIPPIHPITPSPPPLPLQAIPEYTSPQHGNVPATPAPTEPEAPIDGMTLFMEESIARYRDVLKRERELFEEGRSLQIPKLLIAFMEGEVRLRRERYDIPEPAPVKVAEKEARQETVPAVTIEKEPLQNDLVSPPESVQNPFTREESKVPIKVHEAPDAPVIPVTEPQSPPATNFSATLSQVASYMGGPRHAPVPPKATTPKSTSPPPAPPTPEPQVSVPSQTSAEPRLDEPTSKPFKEHPIPPIPQSDTLTLTLASLPTLASPDPILAPLRDRLTALKDISWVETDQLAFDTREQKITTTLLQAAQSRQESHSARHSTLYATNSWPQAVTTFDELEQKYKETELKQTIHRWRTEYCDPTYSRLHGIFGDVSGLHKEVVEMECENTEEQVLLLNDVQKTLMDVLGKMDVVTDELRQRQFELKVFRGHGMGDWEVINQFEKEKGEEDLVLKEQRGEYRLDKLRLHSQCVKYLIDYAVETLSQRKQQVEEEVNKIIGGLKESARIEELPKEGSMDAYPSEELIEQFKEAQLALNDIRQRINVLYGLLEQTELEVITEEAASALTKAYSSTDRTLSEQLNTAQRTKEKSLIDTNLKSRELRNGEGNAFSDQLTSFITAHNGRKQARLAAIAFSSGAGTAGNAMAPLMQDQTRTQNGNMLNTQHMSRMSVINNIGSSNTRYEYVYK